MNDREITALKVSRLSLSNFPCLKQIKQDSDLGKAINDCFLGYKKYWHSRCQHLDLLNQYIDDWNQIPAGQLQATRDGMKTGTHMYLEASSTAEELLFQSDFKRDSEIRDFVLGLGSVEYMK